MLVPERIETYVLNETFLSLDLLPNSVLSIGCTMQENMEQINTYGVLRTNYGMSRGLWQASTMFSPRPIGIRVKLILVVLSVTWYDTLLAE